ncbi:MAG: AAA family ATPase [Polyangiaceae bacterium]|nr:AAA family ATPase [Polyangiaceae bacterium]
MAAARHKLAAGYPLLWWVTHEEQRALATARQLVPTTPVRVWTSTRGLDGDAGLRGVCAALSAIAAEPGAVLVVMLDLHAHLRDGQVLRALRDFVAEAPRARKALLVVSPVLSIPVELEKDVVVMDMPLPDSEQLRELCGVERSKRLVEELDTDALVRAGAGLTWLEAQRAFRLALLRGGPHAVREVVEQKRQALRRSAALELVEADVALGDVGGLEVLKAWLTSRLAAFRPAAKVFGLPEPRGMLVCGVQGCGKSLVAKAASRVFGVPLVRLDFASVFGSGAPELTVRQATRIAEAIAPVVLWVDEIEKGLGGTGGADGGQARVFGDFLVWMQEKRAPVFVAATANEVEHLPPELVRRGRFDDIFFVDLPGARERAEILGIHLRRRGRDAAGYPVEALAKTLEHFSGAEIEQLVIAALFRAYAAGRELQPEDVRACATEVVPLATMYEEKVQALRTWAQARARRASADRRTLELFED